MGASVSGLVSGFASGMDKAKDEDSGSKTGKPEAKPVEYKRGGKVRKTGRAKVHKGERVLTKSQAKRYERKRGRK